MPCSRPVQPQEPSEWQAVRVGRFYGLRVLDRLPRPGAVAVDSAPPSSIVFFVQAGVTDGWPAVPASGVVSLLADFPMPPVERRTPPGAYWLVAPRRGVMLTDDGALLAALSNVIPDWAEAAAQ